MGSMQKKIERTAPKSKVVEHKHQGNIEEKLLIKSQESELCLGIAEFIKFWQKQTGPKVLPFSPRASWMFHFQICTPSLSKMVMHTVNTSKSS